MVPPLPGYHAKVWSSTGIHTTIVMLRWATIPVLNRGIYEEDRVACCSPFFCFRLGRTKSERLPYIGPCQFSAGFVGDKRFWQGSSHSKPPRRDQREEV